jgi:hypothetical protein
MNVTLYKPCNVILANDQLDAQTFLIHYNPLYFSSNILLIFRSPNGHLLRVTIPDAVLIQFDLLKMSKLIIIPLPKLTIELH